MPVIVTWEVNDGYVSGSAPQTTLIDDCDWLECETEEERQDLVSDCVQNDFEQKVTWSINKVDDSQVKAEDSDIFLMDVHSFLLRSR